MKVSLKFAQSVSNVDLKSLSTEELVQLATERLGGIEGVTDIAKQYEGIVVAKVVSCIKHPNADKLSLCKVDDGGVVQDVTRDEEDLVQVVCGAPNVREGLLVAWIPPGAIVPASYGEKELFVLEARDLRGELSNGMLASPAELGMSDDHSGILEIDEDATPGTPFSSLYDLDDVVLEIENKMFTHRPDGFGQLGVARELAGIQGLAFQSPDWYAGHQVELDSGSKSELLSVTIEADDLCLRYMAAVLEDVQIKPSPLWMQSYLKRVGIRPINNVVDITNYIMVLTAQPLHAFDFDKVAHNGRAEISVRRPRAGEKMTLLDGKQIEPHADAALICNVDGPIALAGVMGGGNSEVDSKTTRVVLECATFNMYNIRKTSMAHGIFTDAVTRFNKGQPAGQLDPVLRKAVRLFEEISGAKLVGEPVDNYREPKKNQPVEITLDFINKRLGSSLSIQEIQTILTNVEFDVVVTGDSFRVTAPFWRTDIEIAEDVVEEVGRLYGFNNLPIELPSRSIMPVTPNMQLDLKQQIRSVLSRAGANEVLTYSFVHGKLLEKVGQKPENSYAIRNALSPDLQYYRQSLTPSLLERVHSNIKSGFSQFALFEIGKAHNKIHGNGEDGLPGELNMIACTIADQTSTESGYFVARRYLDQLASSFGLKLQYAKIEQDPQVPVTAAFNTERSALVTVEGADVFLGIVGEYKQSVVKQLKLPATCAGFEIGLDHLADAIAKTPQSKYEPLSKYPSVSQDITLRVSVDTPFASVENVLNGVLTETDYNFDVTPLSVFKKDDDSSKNISFNVVLSHQGHTLTTEEANKVLEDISWAAHEEVNAERI